MSFIHQILRIAAGFMLAALFIPTPLAAQQIDASMLEKVKAMGLTQEQMQSMLFGNSGGIGSNLSNSLGSSLSNSLGSSISGGLGGMNIDGLLNSTSLQQYLYRQQYGGGGIQRAQDVSRESIPGEFTAEVLDMINPWKLQKVISDKIDMEGVLMDVRGGNRGGIYTGGYSGGMTGSGLTGGLSLKTGLAGSRYTSQSFMPLEDSSLFKEYEIVIRDGQYFKRSVPVVFGREIFSGKNLTFEPNYHIATPPDYVLGPNDELVVEAWGAAEFQVRGQITPEGTLTIQQVGPVPVAGLTVAEAETRIRAKVAEVMSGAQVRATLGRIRSIKVNIAGEAMVPGTYTLPSLATVFNALYMAGGVNDIGSLRTIRVYRNNLLITTVDVYDYLINGRSEGNIRLEDNDMIIIPPYEKFVVAGGRVKRERTYEMKEGETLARLLEYAGGVTGDAYRENMNVQRQTGRQYSILTVHNSNFSSFRVEDGDKVNVDRIIDDFANRLTIRGAVWRPGEYELSERTSTLSKLIGLAEGLRGDEFASRGQITRRKPDFTYEIIPFNVREIASGQTDIDLRKEDAVYIPNILEMREDYTIEIKGEVGTPGTIPFRDGMTVEDAILLSGGLRESASLAKIEVARRVKDPMATEYTAQIAELHTFQIPADLGISTSDASFVLHPFDEIFVRRSPGYSEQQSVRVSGEVLYAGSYVLATVGERISDVIRKAGGITPEAYIKGASVKRYLSEDEKARMESVLKTNRGTAEVSEEEVGKALASSYPIGIDVAKALVNPGCNEDIILQDGDEIHVPKYNSIVKISGSVLYPNSVTYNTGSVKSYITQAGGYTKQAWRKPYVIYMNGKVASARGGSRPKVEPGCEIIVPQKSARGGGLSALGTVLGLATNTAALAAAVAALAK